jgi:hypothetical protein
MKPRYRTRPSVELLEDRWTPSLTIVTDTFGNLNILGTPDPDPANPGQTLPITINENAQNMYQVFEGTNEVGGPAAVFFASNALNVNFSQSALNDSVTVVLNTNSVNGNVSINTGAGADSASITGPGSVGGNVTMTGVTGIPTAAFNGAPVAVVNTLDTVNIGGSFTLNSAQKSFPLSFQMPTTSIGGNFAIQEGNGSANILFFAGNTIGGNVTISLGNGAFNNTLLNATIGGSVTYTGGSGVDTVTLIGTVGRSVYLNLGSNLGPLSALANNGFTENAGSTIGGSLTVIGGVGGNTVTVDGLVAGSAYFNLNSAGTAGSSLTFTGFIGGPITYIGGAGPDTVLFNGTTGHSTANFQLGAGSDTFTLGMNTNLSLLYIDFGLDAPGTPPDTFVNNAGATQPRLILRNLA